MPLFRKLKSGQYREAKPAEVRSELGRINQAKVKNRSGGRVWNRHSAKAGDKCRCVQCYLKRGKTMAEIETLRRGTDVKPDVPRGTSPREPGQGTLLRRFWPRGKRFPRPAAVQPQTAGERRSTAAPAAPAAECAAADPNDLAVERILGELPPPRRLPGARPPTGPPRDPVGADPRVRPSSPNPEPAGKPKPPADKKKYEPRPNFGVRSRFYD